MAYNLKETIIIVFAYNRPIHLGKTLKSLSLNPIAREIRTRIIIDGPKSSKDKNNVENTIETAYAQMKSANSEIKVRPTNLGLYASITLGVSEAFEDYEAVIVFEDDHELSPNCLDYLIDGLKEYKSSNRVASIHAYTPPIKDALPETFFLRGALLGLGNMERQMAIFQTRYKCNDKRN